MHAWLTWPARTNAICLIFMKLRECFFCAKKTQKMYLTISSFPCQSLIQFHESTMMHLVIMVRWCSRERATKTFWLRTRRILAKIYQFVFWRWRPLSYGIGTTWEWAINDRITMFGWTNTLNYSALQIHWNHCAFNPHILIFIFCQKLNTPLS